MRKVKIAALLAALLVMLCSCSGEGEPVPYDDPTHRHVYGHWHEAVAPTDTQQGQRVRYCKICHAEQTESVPPVTQTE